MKRLAGRVAVLISIALVSAQFSIAKPKSSADKPAAPISGENWKIDEPHGPTKTLEFATDEGTWIALDIDPQGRELVFSLLGDLYLLPIEGGQARRITSGAAFDVQPRFSPDGQTIAFASDRSGLENLWICDRQGAALRQISKDTKRTVSQPAWSPDGMYLLGRKRITDLSSLGTVELWMYHLKGGEGVQVTNKDSQPDAAEAQFSPDGRFIYFAGRAARFRYDRSPDDGIWQIQRFDRQTGVITPITAEFGGAAAPRLSPDGRSVSLIRRVRGKSYLELLDLASGRMRRLAGPVERDNQEGFAFHGTYPGYAWTPDGQSIITTVDGKLWRYRVNDGIRTAVPFTAQVSQPITEAVRFEPPIAADSLRIRVIRWPVISPDGTRLVFSAAGHLYGMELPQGAPQRLTRASEFEFAPSFSSDGRQLVYTTWDDRHGGHVMVIPAAGGTPRRVTHVPGQYANPAFSPDGQRIVFVASGGSAMRDHDLLEELWLDLRWIEAAGGEAHHIIGTSNRGANRRMTRPSWDPTGERVIYLEDGEAKPSSIPAAVLVSVRLDGTDKRKQIEFGAAEEAAVSPDGQWVVYREAHNVYLTALTALGTTPISVAIGGGALPHKKLTEDSGEWVSWNGRSMSWINGTTLHRLALDKAMPTPEPEPVVKPAEKAEKKGDKKDDKSPAAQDEKKATLPETEKLEISLQLPRQRPTEKVAYTGARVITMKGDEVIERATIVVDGDRIVSVGPEATISIPPGIKSIDLTGRTVIPGLFDEHAHLHYATMDITPQRPWKYHANLAYGITSTHDPSASTHEALGQAEMVEVGLIDGPRIFSTGFILYGANDPNNAQIESLDDARRHLRRLKSLGAWSVKSYMQPRRDVRQWLLQAAREEQMMVVPEGGGDLEMDLTFVLDGHTTIEHALPVAPLRNDVVKLLGSSKTAYTPTLLVAYGGPSGEVWFYQNYEVWKNERLLSLTPQGVIDPRARRRQMLPEEDWHHVNVAAGAKAVIDAGGMVCLGGHGQLQGLGPHWEIWAFRQGGMTALESLRVATLWPAKALGLDKHLGSIEPGKLADFVVLQRNPLEKIEHTDSVEQVIKNGVRYLPSQLARQSTNGDPSISLGGSPIHLDDRIGP